MYFDNASTSFPKPKCVVEGIVNSLINGEGNPQRTTTEDTNLVFETRKKIAELFNVRFPNSIIFTSNSTESLNTVIYGLLEKGDHVITTATEHNSVIRPLIDLKNRGIISISWVSCNNHGKINQSDVLGKINKRTKLVIINHGSNVTGQVQELNQIGNEISKLENTYFLVDVSQTAGHIDIDNSIIKADFLAFTGHKALLGTTGIGGFYINPAIMIKPLKVGGTGVLSELLVQPKSTPIYYESGTQNLVGITSLYYSLDYLKMKKISNIGKDIQNKTEYIIEKLKTFHHIEVYSCKNELGIISFNIKGIQPARISHFLLKDLNMKTRSGLLCAPLIHEFIHNNPFGCVRISISGCTKHEEIDLFLNYIEDLVNNLGSIKTIKVPLIYDLPSISRFKEEDGQL